MAWRLVYQLCVSALLGMFTFYALYGLIAAAIEYRPNVRAVLGVIRNVLGERTIAILCSFGFAVTYMLLLNWRRFRYLEQIGQSVEHISNGHFDETVPVRQRNELTELARRTNELVVQLKRSLDEERKAEQTKNELITNVSHDLRTPLTSILGYLGLIDQDRYRDEVELRQYVAIAYEKSKRLHVLINDLFEYTRMRHDAVTLRYSRLNLVELLGQLLGQHRLSLAEAGMEGRLLPGQSAVMVWGDPDKLVRVFENLLSNAVTYGKDGKRVDISVREEEGEAVVAVVNYGEPIPSTDLPHLFDRFYRVDKSRAEHTGGSGLGLAIVKSLVEKHGGRIRVTSDAMETAFTVTLPLLRERGAGEPREAEVGRSG